MGKFKEFLNALDNKVMSENILTEGVMTDIYKPVRAKAFKKLMSKKLTPKDFIKVEDIFSDDDMYDSFNDVFRPSDDGYEDTDIRGFIASFMYDNYFGNFDGSLWFHEFSDEVLKIITSTLKKYN